MKKKIFLIILVVALCLGITPVIAFAEESDNIVESANVYVYEDEGGRAEFTLTNDTECSITMTVDGQTSTATGTYTLNDSVLSVYVLGEEIGSFRIEGSVLYLVEEETVVDPDPPANAEPTPEPTPEPPPTESENHTYLARLYEFWEAYNDQIITAGGLLLLTISGLIESVIQKRRSKKHTEFLAQIRGNTSTVASAQGGVIETINSLIDGYNELKKSYESYEGAEESRNKIVGAVLVQNAAVLDILTTVYANSKHLPQGVKDLINVKYAKCLSAIDDDEKLKACVEAVRSIVTAEAENTSAEATDQTSDGETGDNSETEG